MVSHLRFVGDHHRLIKKVALASDGMLTSVIPKFMEHVVSAEVKGFGFNERDELLERLEDEGLLKFNGRQVPAVPLSKFIEQLQGRTESPQTGALSNLLFGRKFSMAGPLPGTEVENRRGRRKPAHDDGGALEAEEESVAGLGGRDDNAAVTEKTGDSPFSANPAETCTFWAQREIPKTKKGAFAGSLILIPYGKCSKEDSNLHRLPY